MNYDKFGYYRVGDFKTYSKLEAITLHEKTQQHPQWVFNELEFGATQWHIEPTTSLPELYRMRAQQIRDKYDYIVLFYSGGSDSSNILDTFINYDIKLDECASFWALNGDSGNLDSHFSTEVAKVAIPRMNKHTNILHRLIDLTQLTIDVFDQPDVKFDWIYFMNTYFSPNNYVRSHLRRLIPEYKNLIDQGKSVCFIWGAEKPRLHLVDGKYAVRFQDLVDNTVSPYIQQFARPGEFDELFYWSPDFATGLVKQSHTIMNYLKYGFINPLDFTEVRNKYNYGYTVRDGKTWYLTSDGINKLLYPFWDTNTLSVGKPRSPIYSERDDWFFKTNNNNYNLGIKKLHQLLRSNNYWMNDTSNLLSGVKGCISPPYYLE